MNPDKPIAELLSLARKYAEMPNGEVSLLRRAMQEAITQPGESLHVLRELCDDLRAYYGARLATAFASHPEAASLLDSCNRNLDGWRTAADDIEQLARECERDISTVESYGNDGDL